MSQIPGVHDMQPSAVEGRTKAERNHENREAILDAVFLPLHEEVKEVPSHRDRTGETQWSERVRALLLAQPLNPLQVLEFKPL